VKCRTPVVVIVSEAATVRAATPASMIDLPR
jgi:hypothetical protein